MFDRVLFAHDLSSYAKNSLRCIGCMKIKELLILHVLDPLKVSSWRLEEAKEKAERKLKELIIGSTSENVVRQGTKPCLVLRV
jgi:hypothetical protein